MPPNLPIMEMKERIQEKAAELYDRYGIRSVTMDEIASQLGISKKTIYLSFADKDELVDAVFNKRISQSRTQCIADQQMAQNAIHETFLALDMMSEIMATMNQGILYDLEKYHPVVYKKFLSHKQEFLYKVIVENLNKGIAEELYRSDINPDILARMRIATIMMSFDKNIFPHTQYKPLEVERHIVFHFLYGVASPKGLKMIQKYQQQRLENKIVKA